MPFAKSPLPIVAGSLLLLLTACGGSSPTSPDDPFHSLPTNFSLTGSAESTESDGTTVSCELSLHFTLVGEPRRSAGTLEYDSIHGGFIQRTILDATGSGISLGPDVYGEALVRSIAPDLVEIEIPGNAGTGKRFWEELSRFRGVFDTRDTASGTWSCAPFDIESGGYMDTLYTATGSWALRPEP